MPPYFYTEKKGKKMRTFLIAAFAMMLTVSSLASEKEKNTTVSESESSAVMVVSGTITDSMTGEPLAGVEVQIEGAGVKSYTDFDGNFTFKGLTPGEYKLVTNYISYDQANEALKLNEKQTEVKIKLENSK